MELLSPAGNMSKLKTAVLYGADAVYFGGNFSLRSKAGNFTPEEITEAVGYLHERGKKGYLAVNIFPKERELKEIEDYLKDIAHTGVDALIVADMGVFAAALKTLSGTPIFISTQANVTNSGALELWGKLGAKRVILAREINRGDLAEIVRNSHCETEVFVHGAICVSYSGRCLMSAYMAEREANSGECAQPCRWKYISELTRPAEFLAIEQDSRGTYLYNAKDLCLIGRIGELREMGVSSIKIEGRMKSELYVALTAAVYRRAIDRSLSGDFSCEPAWVEKLESISNRRYTEGFYAGVADYAALNYDTSSYTRKTQLAGVIEKITPLGAEIVCRSRIDQGESVSLVMLSGEDAEFKAEILYGNKNPAFAQNGERVEIALPEGAFCQGMVLRKPSKAL